jgi:hypothetical protein
MAASRLAAAWHVFAVAGALAWVALLGVRPIVHDDVFYHLRTGELVANTGVVPTSDSFTHTLPGTPWTTHEWGFGMLLYGAHRLAGLWGLVALMPLLLVGILLAIYATLRCAVVPERLALVVPLCALGVGAAEPSCLILRATLFTTLGLALVVLLLRRFHTGARAHTVVALLTVFWVWANVHAGVLFGLGVVGLHAAQSVWHALRPSGGGATGHAAARLRGGARRYALLGFGCAGITLVNPNGLDVWTFPLRLNELLYASGLTWNMGIFAAPTPMRHPWFFALALAVLAACLPLRRLKSRLCDPNEPALAHALATAFFLVMALRSNRFIFDFVVLALPFCAMAWGGRGGATAAPPAPPPAPSATAPAGAWLHAGSALVVMLFAVVARPVWPREPFAAHVPVRLADFMARERIAGRMFNPESFGGYLGWRLRLPVYWDGRNDIFGPLAVEFAHARDFGELVARHQLDVAVMEPGYDRRFSGWLLAHRAEWGLVYWDRTAAVYLRRTPRLQPVLARWEYTLLRPFAVPAETEIARLATDDVLRARVEVELKNAFDQSADSFIVWYLRGRIAEARGDPRTAYDAYHRALAIAAHPDALRHLIAVARSLGKRDEARRFETWYRALTGT